MKENTWWKMETSLTLVKKKGRRKEEKEELLRKGKGKQRNELRQLLMALHRPKNHGTIVRTDLPLLANPVVKHSFLRT